jgi:hypothetical protein
MHCFMFNIVSFCFVTLDPGIHGEIASQAVRDWRCIPRIALFLRLYLNGHPLFATSQTARYTRTPRGT